MIERNHKVVFISLAVVLAGLLVFAAPALAAPEWTIHSSSNTTAAPGSTFDYVISARDSGDTDVVFVPFKLRVTLPSGITGVEQVSDFPSCTTILGESTIECEGEGYVQHEQVSISSRLTVKVSPTAVPGEVLTTNFEIEGGGAAASASTLDPIRVSESTPDFGIDAFDAQLLDRSGNLFNQAGGNPADYKVDFDFNTRTNPGTTGRLQTIEASKDIAEEMPPGLLANVGNWTHCSLSELTATDNEGSATPLCPPEAQVGTLIAWNSGDQGNGAPVNRLGPFPVFVMDAPPGSAARLAAKVLATVVVLDAHPRSSGDYGITIGSLNTSEGVTLVGVEFDYWGVPADESHFTQRACPGGRPPFLGGEPCHTTAPPQPFFRLPTSCPSQGKGIASTLRSDSWVHPGTFDRMTSISHEAPGYPRSPDATDPSMRWGQEQGVEGCDQVPFEPSFSAAPTTNRADSPSGLAVDIGIPQGCWGPKATVQEAEESICQSDLKDSVVKLPVGMSINPAAASGLTSCSSAQARLATAIGSTPIHFSEAPVSCPASSKIGAVDIESPLIDHHLKGFIYQAAQGDNPFGSLISLYVVVEDPQTGIKITLPAHVSANAKTGQLETVFDENPQLPFSKFHFELYGGPRAVLRTPPGCGTHTATASFVPWSGNAAVALQSSFKISQCAPGGFDPHLAAGTQNPLAGSYSPFGLRVSREDTTQELGSIAATLPTGLIGRLAGVSYCPEAALAAVSTAPGTGAAELTHPSCPASSQIGTVTVGAGAGPTPYYTTTGRAYLAGPYKGAPLSVAVITPAVAGPFDLGSAVVRNALRIDPETTQVSFQSDPLPSILHGIPLDLRDVRVDLGRSQFTLNPTSCDPKSLDGRIASLGGTSADRSVHFQAAACNRLDFKPKLALHLFGATKRTGHPALRAVLKMKPGGANIAAAAVALPHSEFLDQSHIGTICTRVQFAADTCPARSVYGHATARSPLLDAPLQGPVYLRSSNHKLPDLVAALHGQIDVDAVGRIDSVNGGIRTTFESVPDAPISKFVLSMKGGSKGLLQNSVNLCKAAGRASAKLDAQNGKFSDSSPALQVKCAGGGRAKHGGR